MLNKKIVILVLDLLIIHPMCSTMEKIIGLWVDFNQVVELMYDQYCGNSV